MSDSQALVPVSSASDSLGSTHMGGPDSPQDIKPAILTFDEPPISPVAGPSHQSDRSMMMYMDNSPMPSTSSGSFQEQALVQHDSQPQDETTECAESQERSTVFLDSSMRTRRAINQKYKCEICAFQSYNITRFESHVAAAHKAQVKHCAHCTKVFMNHNNYQLHMATHVTLHTCIYCEKKFKCKSSLKKHENSHLCLSEVECHVCSKTFRSKETWKRHLMVCHNMQPPMNVVTAEQFPHRQMK